MSTVSVLALVTIVLLLISAPIFWKATEGWRVGTVRLASMFAHAVAAVCAGVWGFVEAGAAFALTGVVGALVFAAAALVTGIFLSREKNANGSRRQ